MTETPFQPMPPLSIEQVTALREDIEARGIIVPIIVDQHGRVLDGHNRLALAAKLGIDCPREVRHVADDEEAADLAVTLNCARRHLTRDQVRQVIVSEADRRPADSDRTIARRVGCSPSTVAAVLRPQVSNLDSNMMSVAEAKELTATIRNVMSDTRHQLVVQAISALTNKITVAEIVTAFTQAIRSLEVDGMDEHHVLRNYVFTPIIDWLLEPETAENYRAQWDHETFLPLTDDERAAALACLAGNFR